MERKVFECLNLVLGKKNSQSIFFLLDGTRTVAKAISVRSVEKAPCRESCRNRWASQHGGNFRFLPWVTLGTVSLQKLVVALIGLSQRIHWHPTRDAKEGRKRTTSLCPFSFLNVDIFRPKHEKPDCHFISTGSAVSQSTSCAGLGGLQEKAQE